MWMPESNRLDQALALEFTQKTGIVVHIVPGSESGSQRLAQEMALLKNVSSGVDVFQVDTVWPGAVAAYMSDLRDALRNDLSDELPQVVENAIVGGRLIAAPFYVDYGILYYRTDLLRKYGFSHPPQTWDELEKQSLRIEHGERQNAVKDFWAYVWEGADYEGLTCNALEWESSQGGGNMLRDHTVTVDNPATVHAFSRAAGWIGVISPPGVVAYLEEDARNVWESGKAAFMRNWTYVYPLAGRSSTVGKRFSAAPMPAGVAGHATVLGGWYLGIAKRTQHKPEAIAFVRYMISKEVQRQRAIKGAFLPTIASLYRDPKVLRAYPFWSSLLTMSKYVVRRPASLVGAEYSRASQEYAHEVHLVLTKRSGASEAARNIDQELRSLTGFPSTNVPLPGVRREHQ